MTLVAGIFVLCNCFWLMGVAVWIVFAPASGERFLKRFASTATAHYVEQVLRLIAGSSIVVFAGEMRFP